MAIYLEIPITLTQYHYGHVCHDYADHLVIDGSTLYFAQAYDLTQRVGNGHFNFNQPGERASSEHMLD